MNPKKKALLVTLACAVALAAIFHAPLRWTAQKVQRKIQPEQIPEGPVYADTAKAAVDLATFVRDARGAWPQANIAVVHAVALEVATGLLLRPDIEVGSMVDGKFAPWRMSPWTAAEKIHEQLDGMSGFLSEPGRYVFRRKTT